jgi:hypothetical protein
MAGYVVDTEILNTTEALTGNGDSLLVSGSGSLIFPEYVAIDSEANNQGITVDGLVYGNLAMILNNSDTSVDVNGTVQGAGVGGVGIIVQTITTAATMSNVITVGSQGTVEGEDYAVQFSEPIVVGVYGPETFNTLTNDGTIQSQGVAGVSAIGDGGDTFSNSGKIAGTEGIQFLVNSNTETVENSGTIQGTTGAAIYSSSHVGKTNYLSVGIEVDNYGTGLLTNAASNGNAVLYFDDGPGTVSIINNQGIISGAGYVIQSASDLLQISNSGTIHGGLETAVSGTTVDNSGVWQPSAGTPTALLVSGGSSELTNSGKIDGPVQFTGSSDSMTNSGSISGKVTMGSASTFVNTGTVHGGVTLGLSDTMNDSRGEITDGITAAASDTFIYKGNFGNEEISGFVTGTNHDTINFGTSDFASFTALSKHMTQAGANVVIRLDAADSITLDNITLASLSATDFKFV